MLQARPDGLRRVPRRDPAGSRTAIKGPGFPVEVYNVLGAGDAFMSGFLRGWLRGEPLATCCAYANACGAFAVSRLLCSPEYPTWPELQLFLEHGIARTARCARTRRSTMSTGRPRAARSAGSLMALAIDHRAQFEEIADAAGAPRERINAFKRARGRGRRAGAAGRPGFGMLLDGTYGREALFRAADHGFWIGRPVEKPGSRPLDFEVGARLLGAHLAEWPVTHTVKVLSFYHPDDPAEHEAPPGARAAAPSDAARSVGRELLVEIIAAKHGPVTTRRSPASCARLYAIGIKPDWWKLEPQPSRRGLGGGRRARSRPAIRFAAAWCCWGWKRRRRTWPSLPHRRAMRPREGLRSRTHHLRRCRQGLARRADGRRRGCRRDGGALLPSRERMGAGARAGG